MFFFVAVPFSFFFFLFFLLSYIYVSFSAHFVFVTSCFRFSALRYVSRTDSTEHRTGRGRWYLPKSGNSFFLGFFVCLFRFFFFFRLPAIQWDFLHFTSILYLRNVTRIAFHLGLFFAPFSLKSHVARSVGLCCSDPFNITVPLYRFRLSGGFFIAPSQRELKSPVSRWFPPPGCPRNPLSVFIFDSIRHGCSARILAHHALVEGSNSFFGVLPSVVARINPFSVFSALLCWFSRYSQCRRFLFFLTMRTLGLSSEFHSLHCHFTVFW